MIKTCPSKYEFPHTIGDKTVTSTSLTEQLIPGCAKKFTLLERDLVK